MSVVTVTDSNIQDVADNSEILVLDIWAQWCAPCKKFAPIFERASESHPEITFGKVEADLNPGVLQHFRIQSIPTILVIRNNQAILIQRGFLSEPDFEDFLARAATIN